MTIERLDENKIMKEIRDDNTHIKLKMNFARRLQE